MFAVEKEAEMMGIKFISFIYLCPPDFARLTQSLQHKL